MSSNANFQPLFISNKLIKFLFSYGRRRLVAEGETFIREGDQSHNCFVLLEGEADILKEDENGHSAIVGKINQGSIIGEMGVFLQVRRSTSVQAASRLVLLEFTAPCFYKAVEDIPELAVRLIKSLAEKLNAANHHAVTRQEQKHRDQYPELPSVSITVESTSTN